MNSQTMMNSQVRNQEGTKKLIIATTGVLVICEQLGVGILRSRQYVICSNSIVPYLSNVVLNAMQHAKYQTQFKQLPSYHSQNIT